LSLQVRQSETPQVVVPASLQGEFNKASEPIVTSAFHSIRQMQDKGTPEEVILRVVREHGWSMAFARWACQRVTEYGPNVEFAFGPGPADRPRSSTRVTELLVEGVGLFIVAIALMQTLEIFRFSLWAPRTLFSAFEDGRSCLALLLMSLGIGRIARARERPAFFWGTLGLLFLSPLFAAILAALPRPKYPWTSEPTKAE